MKVIKEATDDKEIKIINVEESHQEDVETLTTIVEVGEQEKGKDQREREANVDNENSVMMALSQLSKLMGEIEEPKQDIFFKNTNGVSIRMKLFPPACKRGR